MEQIVETEVTRDDARRAAVKLIDNGPDENMGVRMSKRAFTAIYEAAFATPVAGVKYKEEITDLLCWVAESCKNDDDPLCRLLGTGFAFSWGWYSVASDAPLDDPFLREAFVDFVRAAAVFRLREQAFLIAQGMKDDEQREGGAA